MLSRDLLEAMGKYNEQLVNAGKRVAFDGPGRTVIDGPFA